MAANAQNFEWRYTNSPLTVFAQQPGNPNVVFAGDKAGLIRKSSDKGATWSIVSLQSELPISDIAFLHSQKGFAATTQPGFFLATIDGGTTWQRKQFVDAQNPDNASRFHPTARIVVVDEQTAFFDIFNHPISNPSARETIVTRDGGNTFRIDSVPGKIYHVTDGTMMAFGREVDKFGLSKFTVYKSTDKGMSWNIVKTSPTGIGKDFNNNGIELAFFLSADEFFLTPNKQLTSDYFIYKTTDGGNTFTALPAFIAGRKAKAEYLYFKNSSEGVALSQPANGETAFYTTDGGQTWTPANQKPQSVALHLGGNELLAYKDDHTTFSTDFGKTWVDQSDPINSIRDRTSAPSLQFLQVLDNKTMIASIGTLSSGVYYGREVVQTTNGGLSWHQIKNSEGKPFQGEAFYFVSKDTFFFTGTGYKENTSQGGYLKIKYTTDGGKTAQDLFTGSYNEDVQQIVRIDNQHFATYSNNSSIINFSSDGGEHWEAVSPKLGSIEQVVFPSPDSWYLRTADKKIWNSTNRGTTWTDVSGSMNCGSLLFTTPTTGYVHGCANKLYKTTDGGTAWNDITSGLADNIKNNSFTSMAFHNETVGYMASRNTSGLYGIAQTTDNGDTWQWYTRSQIGTRIARIHFANENTGAMMDVSGNIAIYTQPTTFTTDTLKLGKSAVSVHEQLPTPSRMLYPNPTSDFVVVETGSAPVQLVEVADMLGRVHIRLQPESGSTVNTIATSGLPIGTYIVTLKTATQLYTQHLHIVR